MALRMQAEESRYTTVGPHFGGCKADGAARDPISLLKLRVLDARISMQIAASPKSLHGVFCVVLGEGTVYMIILVPVSALQLYM